MTEETKGATGTQAEPVTQPQAGIPPSQAGAGTGEQPSGQPESISLDEARKLRSEAKGLRERLKVLEDEKTKAAEATLSETERSAKRLADLERELADRDRAIQERTLYASAIEAASRLGFAQPRFAHKLLDHSAIEFDAEGVPMNVERLLQDLLKEAPNLKSAHATPSGSIDGGTRGAPGLTLEQINRMTPEEHAKRRDEVMAFVASQGNK